MADHHDLAPLLAHLRDLDVNLGDQRAGRVEHGEPARLGVRAHGARHAVGRENHRTARRNGREVVDEDRSLGLEIVDDEAVVHDLVAHVDRSAEPVQRLFDDRDRPVDAGAETARVGKQDVHQRSFARGGGTAERRWRKLSRMRSAAPTVIAESATLNAG